MKAGRSLSWEALATTTDLENLTLQFINAAVVAGGFTSRFRVLIPVNVSRGPITLLRIRGRMLTTWTETMLAAASGTERVAVPYNIQLVNIRNGAIDPSGVLDPRSGADMESNRIIWRYTAYPTFGARGGVNVGATNVFTETYDIDVKVKRRFDRATWALIMCVSYDSADEVLVDTSLDMRALFMTPDGV